MCLITVFEIICVSMGCLTDDVKYTHAVRTCFEFGAVSKLRIWFRTSKASLSSPLVFLLIVPRRFLCCRSSLLVHRWFHTRRLFSNCSFLISSSFGASLRL